MHIIVWQYKANKTKFLGNTNQILECRSGDTKVKAVNESFDEEVEVWYWPKYLGER